jgi:hypothetical protein
MTEQPLKMSRLLSFFLNIKAGREEEEKEIKNKRETNFLRMESGGRMLCASS